MTQPREALRSPTVRRKSSRALFPASVGSQCIRVLTKATSRPAVISMSSKSKTTGSFDVEKKRSLLEPPPGRLAAQPRAAASIFRTSNFFMSMNAAITRSAFF